ncbi:hypothetical protein L2E82_01896 [Cichorium intybus]|uniref:Uncharacterized protein n=1 Tax=Cichorium intybus TaxID=13427 RepID=A0ACB9H190_CICIN|nr:hypothetical protein L2E82_01896 [Cichorium intybus]
MGPDPTHPTRHTFQKACVVVYPRTVQNGFVWIWPNTDPKYKDILSKKKPPYIAQLDDPSFTFQIYNRDIPYGYVLNSKFPSKLLKKTNSFIDQESDTFSSFSLKELLRLCQKIEKDATLGVHINKGLLALGNVISALGDEKERRCTCCILRY